MPVPSVITDLSVIAASNSPAGSDPIGTSLDDYLRSVQAIVKREQSQGAAIASASTTAIGGNTDGNYLHITGTTAITSFGTVAAGISRTVVFDGILTLTNSANLILPGGANITTAAGDVAEFVSEGGGIWRCSMYAKSAGLGTASSLNVGTSANNVVQLDGSAKLPALDASNLTNLNVGGYAGYSGNQTILASQTGITLYYSSASAGTFTLPAASTVSAGKKFEFWNYGPGLLTVSKTGVDVLIRDGLNSYTSLTLLPGEVLELLSGGVSNIYAITKKTGAFRYESAEQTLAQFITLSHGGPRVPDSFKSYLRCKTAEAGYSVGDEIPYTYISGGNNIQADWANATQIGFSAQGVTWGLAHKTTGASTALTAANWKMVFRATWI